MLPKTLKNIKNLPSKAEKVIPQFLLACTAIIDIIAPQLTLKKQRENAGKPDAEQQFGADDLLPAIRELLQQNLCLPQGFNALTLVEANDCLNFLQQYTIYYQLKKTTQYHCAHDGNIGYNVATVLGILSELLSSNPQNNPRMQNHTTPDDMLNLIKNLTHIFKNIPGVPQKMQALKQRDPSWQAFNCLAVSKIEELESIAHELKEEILVYQKDVNEALAALKQEESIVDTELLALYQAGGIKGEQFILKRKQLSLLADTMMLRKKKIAASNKLLEPLNEALNSSSHPLIALNKFYKNLHAYESEIKGQSTSQDTGFIQKIKQILFKILSTLKPTAEDRLFKSLNSSYRLMEEQPENSPLVSPSAHRP